MMTKTGGLDILWDDADDRYQLLYIITQFVTFASGDNDGSNGELVACMEILHQLGDVVLQALFVDDDEIIFKTQCFIHILNVRARQN